MNHQSKLAAVERKLFINGHYVESKAGKSFSVISPSTETVICEGVAATNEDVDFAVESARKAFNSK